MAELDQGYTETEAIQFVEIFDSLANKANAVSSQLESILKSPYNNKKDIYNATKPAITNAENTFSNFANKVEKDSPEIDPCVSAGFYLNQIMWDINMAKDAENRLESINIVDLKQFLDEFRYDVARFAQFADWCSYKNKMNYKIY